ncbi:MAG: saccharopine dehydrogenase NADP-binding domain-containing protein, partial [Caulobacterales bacterium]|nr:saccharopine dehydrogenase NADP-binding domain-containing protein [Caulobacterales bacterium]
MKTIAVLGLGKIGALAAQLLHYSGFTVIACDTQPPSGAHAFDVKQVDASALTALTDIGADIDAVLSCLPYHLNTHVAALAHQHGAHYFDLTEDVPTTQAILALGQTSDRLMAPQCGLAPGFVGVVGAHLIEQ